MLPFYEDKFDFATLSISAENISSIIDNVNGKAVTSAAGKKIFELLFNGDQRSVEQIIKDDGFSKVTDETALLVWIDAAISENPKQTEMYKGGKESLFGFFVGQVMKKSRGAADGNLVKSLLAKRLT
jgi:aspartyl-tRNA(Asn)/glutamyl-tRNA(Gln) amidotransferase subunit B